MSEDHKPDNLDEKNRILTAGGFVEDNRVNGSLNLSRSLGDFEYKSNTSLNYIEQMVTCLPEITKTERSSSDKYLILACDGIWDCLSNQECVNLVSEYMGQRGCSVDQMPKATSVCVEKMFDKICAGDIMQSGGIGTDNMTCIIVEFF